MKKLLLVIFLLVTTFSVVDAGGPSVNGFAGECIVDGSPVNADVEISASGWVLYECGDEWGFINALDPDAERISPIRESFFAGEFNPTGDSFVGIIRDGGEQMLVVLKIGNPDYELMIPVPREVRKAALSPSGETFAYFQNEGVVVGDVSTAVTFHIPLPALAYVQDLAVIEDYVAVSTTLGVQIYQLSGFDSESLYAELILELDRQISFLAVNVDGILAISSFVGIEESESGWELGIWWGDDEMGRYIPIPQPDGMKTSRMTPFFPSWTSDGNELILRSEYFVQLFAPLISTQSHIYLAAQWGQGTSGRLESVAMIGRDFYWTFEGASGSTLRD